QQQQQGTRAEKKICLSKIGNEGIDASSLFFITANCSDIGQQWIETLSSHINEYLEGGSACKSLQELTLNVKQDQTNNAEMQDIRQDGDIDNQEMMIVD
ncbi:hypothetical protein RFI_23969, partial [Reticulomyxa filosa]